MATNTNPDTNTNDRIPHPDDAKDDTKSSKDEKTKEKVTSRFSAGGKKFRIVEEEAKESNFTAALKNGGLVLAGAAGAFATQWVWRQIWPAAVAVPVAAPIPIPIPMPKIVVGGK